jgi:hypothetical protein
MEITIKLLENAMQEVRDNQTLLKELKWQFLDRPTKVEKARSAF